MSHDHEADHDLFEAIVNLKNTDEALRFFKDLCTPQEINALKERWRVCQLLNRGDLSYREIHQITGASLTTIGRVARFLKDEPHHGYKTMLTRMKRKPKT